MQQAVHGYELESCDRQTPYTPLHANEARRDFCSHPGLQTAFLLTNQQRQEKAIISQHLLLPFPFSFLSLSLFSPSCLSLLTACGCLCLNLSLTILPKLEGAGPAI
jgi:hypothetical protein